MASVVRISKDVCDNLRHGVTTVGATAVPVSTVPLNAMKGVQIKATKANTHIICIGAIGVTMANGIQLGPGEGVFVPLSDISATYAIAGAAAQEIRWLVS